MRYEPFLLLSFYRVFFRALIAVWLPGPVSWGSDPPSSGPTWFYLSPLLPLPGRIAFVAYVVFVFRPLLRAYDIQFSGIGARSPFASIAESRKFKRGADFIQKKKGPAGYGLPSHDD